jgi:hypothetical protein
MFAYAKLKDSLEQVKCAVHNQTAVVNFVDGKVNFDSVCCEAHKNKLLEMLPEIEEQNAVSDILEDVY